MKTSHVGDGHGAKCGHCGHGREIMTTEQLAGYTGLSVSYYKQSRINGARKNLCPPPPCIRLGRKIRYLKADVDAWLQAHRKGFATSGEAQ